MPAVRSSSLRGFGIGVRSEETYAGAELRERDGRNGEQDHCACGGYRRAFAQGITPSLPGAIFVPQRRGDQRSYSSRTSMKGREFGHDIRTKAAASGRCLYNIGLHGRAVSEGVDWRSRRGIRVKGQSFPASRRREAQHLSVQPRRSARRVPRRHRSSSIHAQDPPVVKRWSTLHPVLRCGPFLLPVAGVDDDRSVSPQQRGPAPARRHQLRRTALDGVLPTQRRLRHLPFGQVPQQLARHDTTALFRPLDGLVGRLHKRHGSSRRSLAEYQRVFHDLPRHPRTRVHHPVAVGWLTVPVVRGSACTALVRGEET